MTVSLRAGGLLACLCWLGPLGAHAQSVPDGVISSSDPITEISTDVPAADGEIEDLREQIRRLEADRDRLESSLQDIETQLAQSDGPPAANDGVPGRVGIGEVIRIAAGEVVEEAVGIGEDIEVAGRVEGDTTSLGGNIIVASSGSIGGDAVSFGGEVIVREGGEVFGDRISLTLPISLTPTEVQGPLGAGALTSSVKLDTLLSDLYQRVVWFLSFTGAGVLLVGLFPSRVGRIAESVQAHPFRATSVGILTTGFLSVFSVLFALVTLGLGLPVSLMVIGLLGCAWMLGFVGLCQAVGDLLPFESRPKGRWLAFFVGSLLLTCISSLPFLGWMVLIAGSAMGVGAAFSTRLGGR